jgi:hypothetical protein
VYLTLELEKISAAQLPFPEMISVADGELLGLA